jgi:hypothetical protein
MVDILMDNIFVVVGKHAVQLTVDIPMGTYCAPLIAECCPYSYDTDFMQELLRNRKGARSFTFTFLYTEKIEDTKGIIKSRKSKDRQCNRQRKQGKKTINNQYK